MWHNLEAMSVRMEAERRIGKTSILHKMAAQPPEGWEPVSLDFEQIHRQPSSPKKSAKKSMIALPAGRNRDGEFKLVGVAQRLGGRAHQVSR